MQPDGDILSALRKAHLIAAKLKLTEFDIWIQRELNGYEQCTRTEIPEYRKLKGALKFYNPYYGWCPALLRDDELEKMVCEQKMPMSLAELQDLYRQIDDVFVYQFPAGLCESLSESFQTPDLMQFALHISKHHIASIVEKVRNTLLEWTIKLEAEGILGDNMTFKQEEKDTAKVIPQQINYYGPVINGNVSSSQVLSGDGNTITYNAADVKNAVSEITEALNNENLSDEDKETAIELLGEISQKLDQGKKPGIIKSALVGLKDFVLAAGANVTAALITAKIQGLF